MTLLQLAKLTAISSLAMRPSTRAATPTGPYPLCLAHFAQVAAANGDARNARHRHAHTDEIGAGLIAAATPATVDLIDLDTAPLP